MGTAGTTWTTDLNAPEPSDTTLLDPFATDTAKEPSPSAATSPVPPPRGTWDKTPVLLAFGALALLAALERPAIMFLRRHRVYSPALHMTSEPPLSRRTSLMFAGAGVGLCAAAFGGMAGRESGVRGPPGVGQGREEGKEEEQRRAVYLLTGEDPTGRGEIREFPDE